MWNKNDESMAGDMSNTTGAGYLNKTTDFDSPNASAKKQAGAGGKRANSVTPVCIGMLTQCRKDEFTLFEKPTYVLKLVAIVRKIDITSTTGNYELEDHTGTIKAILWLESETTEIGVDKENVYVRVYGTLRVRNGEKIIMIIKIQPIDYLDEITSHLIEVVYIRIIAEKKSKGEATGIKANNPGAELTNSMASYEGGAAMEEASMKPVQRKIYQYMKSTRTSSEAGIARKDIWAQFSPNQRSEVDEAIHFLVGEGHIFSTIDTDHFQLTTS